MALHLVRPALKPDETSVERVRKLIWRHPKPAAMIQCNRCGRGTVIETG